MNSFRLYADEMLGFIRSKVMLVLMIGLPVLITVLRLIQPDTEGMPFFAFTAIIMASVGGTLGAVLLSTSITNERARHVYDLFLVRPVTRPQLLLAKYFAALTVLLGTALLSLSVSLVADWFAGRAPGNLVKVAINPIVLSLSGMAIACSVGVLLGVLVDSVAASAILSVYLGNQLSAVAVLPSVMSTNLPVVAIAVAAGVGVGGIVLTIAVLVFGRKTL